MKKVISFIIGIVALISGCNNPRTNFSDVQVVNDSTELAAKIDSAHSIKQDGLDYDPLNTGTYKQLPDTVTQWLNKNYAGWSLPIIPEDHLKEAKKTAPGPFYLKLDYNKDQVADYAVLYQYQDSVTVAVYLVKRTGQLQEFILERHPVATISGEEKSWQYLIVPEKGKTVYIAQTNKKVALPEQALGVVDKENNTRFYFYNGKSFSLANSQ